MSDTSFTSKALNTAVPIISLAPSGLAVATYSLVTGLNGTFSYLVTPFNGGEGIPSQAVSYTNSVGSGLAVSFSGVTNALGYRLYRSGAGDTYYKNVANGISSPLYDTFQINGEALPSGNTTALESRALATVSSKYYQTPAALRTLFKEAIFANSHSDTVSFSLYIVPSGEVAHRGNVIFNSVTLESNETKILSLNTVMDAGDSIQAKASDIGLQAGYGVVSIKISGIEISDT